MTDSGSEGAKHKCVKGINEIGTAWCTTHDQNWIHKDCEESAASETGEPLRMNAYYYSFNETGSLEIDGILSAVAVAGKAFHHTQNWSDEDSNYGDGSLIDLIQNKAIAAANQIASLTERVKELENKNAEDLKKLREAVDLGSSQAEQYDKEVLLMKHYRKLYDEVSDALEKAFGPLGQETDGMSSYEPLETVKALQSQLNAANKRNGELEEVLRVWRGISHNRYKKFCSMRAEVIKLETQLDAANKRNEELGREVKRYRYIDSYGWKEKIAALTRQLDKQGEAIEILLPMAKELQRNFPSGTGRENIEIAEEAIQSAAEIREGER